MSFGYSVGDIITTSQLCWSVYRACKDAPGNYKDVTAELESLHINLKNLGDEVENPKSLLNRRGEALRDEFNQILENVQKSLKNLEQMVLKYRSLGTLEKRTWDRMRFGLKDLNAIRQKLIYHTAQIKLFLSNLAMSSLGRIESLLEDFIQEIRSGKRAPTLLSIDQGGDEAAVGWKQLESDLSEGGIPFEDIERHRDDIEEYLAQITMGLDLNPNSPTVELAAGGSLLEVTVEQVPEDNWDSISERMAASNEDTTTPIEQTEQSSASKLDVVLPIKDTAENGHAQRNGRGFNPEATFKYTFPPLQLKDPITPSQNSGRLKFFPRNPDGASMIDIDMKNEAKRQRIDSDDDENMVTTQSRRKIQNQTAKQTFPEREKPYLNDLETKLAAFEKTTLTIAEENERLKLQLQKASTENEILKATSAAPPSSYGPIHLSPNEFYTPVLQAHENKTPSHRIVTSVTGERSLAVGAAWDYIQKHPLFVRDLVDVGDVSNRLKYVAKSDGQGAVFEERDIINAIEKSIASGADHLL